MLSTMSSTALILVLTICLQAQTRLSGPKIMGNKVPFHALSPFKKQTQRKIVKYHNHFRTVVDPPASNMLTMKWHKGAAKAAQRWAGECMFLTHDNVTGRHINDYGSCGQNIFVSTHTVPWLFAMKAWFSEKDDFTYGSDYNVLKVVGHYTQMVWAATHQVGCGFAKCYRNSGFSKKLYYNYVCNYCPIGNRPVQLGKPYESGRPCESCRNSCHRRKLCTNACHYADNWSNCRELHARWSDWLCKSDTETGKERLSHCKATCLCTGKIYD